MITDISDSVFGMGPDIHECPFCDRELTPKEIAEYGMCYECVSTGAAKR